MLCHHNWQICFHSLGENGNLVKADEEDFFLVYGCNYCRTGKLGSLAGMRQKNYADLGDLPTPKIF